MRALALLIVLATPLAAGAEARYGVVDTIPLADDGGGIDYIKLDAANERIFIGREHAAIVIDLKSKTSRKITALVSGNAALLTSRGDTVLVTDRGAARAALVDIANGATLAEFPMGEPDGAWEAGDNRAIITGDGYVAVIDTLARKRLGSINVPGHAEGAFVLGDAGYVDVEEKNAVALISLKTFKVIRYFPIKTSICRAPHALVQAGVDRMIVACDRTSTAVLMSTGSGEVIDSIKISETGVFKRGFVDGAAYDAHQQLAFVPSGGGRRGILAVIAVSRLHLKIVQKVPTAIGAMQVVHDSSNGRLYLATVDVIRGSPEAEWPVVPGSYRLIVLGGLRNH